MTDSPIDPRHAALMAHYVTATVYQMSTSLVLARERTAGIAPNPCVEGPSRLCIPRKANCAVGVDKGLSESPGCCLQTRCRTVLVISIRLRMSTSSKRQVVPAGIRVRMRWAPVQKGLVVAPQFNISNRPLQQRCKRIQDMVALMIGQMFLSRCGRLSISCATPVCSPSDGSRRCPAVERPGSRPSRNEYCWPS